MNIKRSGLVLAVGMLVLTASEAASAKRECSVFVLPSGHANREYDSCKECLAYHRRCEERCTESGIVCTVVGRDARGYSEKIRGDIAKQEEKARNRAVARCQEAGLSDCVVAQCTMVERVHDPRPCREVQPQPRPQPQPPRPSPPPQPPQPPQMKHVRSWQHVKEQCLPKPYPKIAQQCGNRVNFWQGIRCRVTWSDGSTTDVAGQVDLVDAYGRSYCTRATRPAQFNCVNSCDNANGPLITLPKP